MPENFPEQKALKDSQNPENPKWNEFLKIS